MSFIFLDPKTLIGIRNLTFGGVILLTFFDPSYGFRYFWGRWCQNMEFSTPKPMLGSKNIRIMTPPKSEVSDAKRSFGVQKISKGAQKNEKNCFSQKGPILYFT